MIFTWILFAILGLISSLINGTSWYNEEVAAYIVIFLCTICVIAETLYWFRHEKIKYTYIVALGYFIRVAIILWDIYAQSILKLPETGTDTEAFHRAALLKMDNLAAAYGGLYTDILGLIYKTFGPSRVIGQYINALFWATTVFFLYKIMKKLDVSKKITQFGLYIICFAPHYLITNCEMLRECVISMTLCISFYFFIVWWTDKQKTRMLILSLGICLIASIFHSGAIAPAIGYILTAILYDKKNQKFRIGFYTVFGLIVAFLAFSYLNTRYGSLFFSRFQTIDIEQRLERISTGSGGSGYQAGFNIANPVLSVIINTPIKALYFWAAPLPWDWRGLSDVVAFLLSSLLYIYCYIDIIKQLRRYRISHDDGLLLIACLLIMIAASVVFSWGVSNAGTAIRHRDKFIVIYITMWVLTRQASEHAKLRK